MKICLICSDPFQEKQKTEKYCSTKCAYKVIKQKQYERNLRRGRKTSRNNIKNSV